MPERSPNHIQPEFQKRYAALARTSPSLHALLRDVLALNAEDDRFYVSTATNAHVYLGRAFLVRVEFERGGSIALHNDTPKDIAADAHREHAPSFLLGVERTVMHAGGFRDRWASMRDARSVLTLTASTPESGATAVLQRFRDALSDGS